MIALNLTVAISGSALLMAPALTLWHKRRGANACEPEPMICEVPSPDDSLCCSQEIAHTGWHSHQESAWFGSVFFRDPWADTQEAAIDLEPALDTANWEPEPQPELQPEPEPKLQPEPNPVSESPSNRKRDKYRENARRIRRDAKASFTEKVHQEALRECSDTFVENSPRREKKPYRTVLFGENPSDAEISASRFAERWINNDLTIGSSRSPHKSQASIFRVNSRRPWNGPRNAA